MKQFVKPGFALGKALAFLGAFCISAYADTPYLPALGPVPLRVQTVAHVATNSVAKIASVPVAATATTNTPAKSLDPAAAPDASTLAKISPPNFAMVSSDANAESIFTLPTPDLMGITPQMLATYFRPGPGTNVIITDVFPLTFTPPLPADKSSHAEYILK